MTMFAPHMCPWLAREGILLLHVICVKNAYDQDKDSLMPLK